MNEQESTRARILGVLIQDARVHAGRSAADCAQLLGMSPETFAKAERGEYIISLPELEVLAIYLDVPMAHFWGSQTLGTPKRPDYQTLLMLRHKIIGGLLRRARLETGKSEEQLAAEASITPDELREYELGHKMVPILELERLGRALGVSLAYFVDDDRGPLGRHENEQKMRRYFNELPPDVKAFVVEPVNIGYLETAIRLSQLDVYRLRQIAEGLLDITL
jgi:transcriptional regulator with XRE-family HTH domain